MHWERIHYLQTIRERLATNCVMALTGPRQVGKTTLARKIQQLTLADSGEAHFFDLESPKDLARLENPELALSPLKGLVILDEIQRKPELFAVLRVLADRENLPARFLVLGSASPDLMKGASESLAGRISFIDVSGFSLQEIGAKHWLQLWLRGGFPRAFLAETDTIAQQWHEDFVRTFLERDIPQFGLRIPAITLRRFWTMLAHYHGQVLKHSELARSLGTSEPTVRRYLDILSGTFMIRQLPPWFENLKKRQVKSPKIYLRDSGILHALLGIRNQEALESHPKLGASWEGFCIEQILARHGDREAFFWATHASAELDLLLLKDGEPFGIEFKNSDHPIVTKSMRIALNDLSLKHLYIVYRGNDTIALDATITAVPLSFLLTPQAFWQM